MQNDPTHDPVWRDFHATRVDPLLDLESDRDWWRRIAEELSDENEDLREIIRDVGLVELATENLRLRRQFDDLADAAEESTRRAKELAETADAARSVAERAVQIVETLRQRLAEHREDA